MLTSSRFETLQDNECKVLLELIKRKDGGYVQAASDKLTPLVKAMYDGEEFPIRLKLEDVEEASLLAIEPAHFVELCAEVSDIDPRITE